MKKKIFAFIFAAAASFLIFAGFSACKKEDSETNGIIFNTLIINDASANLSVSNATEEFSFETIERRLRRAITFFTFLKRLTTRLRILS